MLPDAQGLSVWLSSVEKIATGSLSAFEELKYSMQGNPFYLPAAPWTHRLLPCKKLCLSHLGKLWPMAEEGLRLSGGSKTEQLHHKTPVHTLRKRHLDAMLSPCNTCYCSTEILWFPTFTLYMPVAFPMHRKRRLERILCIWSLVSQTILPSGFVLHFKVDLGKSKSFAVCTIKKKKVGSKCKKGFHQCL